MRRNMSELRTNHRGPARLGALAAAALLALTLAACGGADKPVYVEKPVEELYNGAMNAMQVGDYQEAARLFDEVERQHPSRAEERRVGTEGFGTCRSRRR